MGCFIRKHERERPDAHRPDIRGITRHSVLKLTKSIPIIQLKIAYQTLLIIWYDITQKP